MENNTNIIGKRLDKALLQRNFTPDMLSEVTGIGKSRIISYILGEAIPNKHTIALISAALAICESWLAGEDMPMDHTEFALKHMGKNVSKYAAEYGKFEFGARIALAKPAETKFCFVMPDNSMDKFGIKKGDVVFYQRTNEINDGDFAVMYDRNKLIVRLVRIQKGITYLICEKSDYAEYRFKERIAERYKIIGTAKTFQSVPKMICHK